MQVFNQIHELLSQIEVSNVVTNLSSHGVLESIFCKWKWVQSTKTDSEDSIKFQNFIISLWRIYIE